MTGLYILGLYGAKYGIVDVPTWGLYIIRGLLPTLCEILGVIHPYYLTQGG